MFFIDGVRGQNQKMMKNRLKLVKNMVKLMKNMVTLKFEFFLKNFTTLLWVKGGKIQTNYEKQVKIDEKHGEI